MAKENKNKVVTSSTVSSAKGRRTKTVVVSSIDKNGNKVTRSHTRSFNGLGLLSIIAVILLLASLFSVLTNSSEKTFYSLLTMLQNVPDVLPADKIISFFSFESFSLNLPNWLDWINPIINVTGSLLTVLAFLVKGAISALTLLFYFVRWLFI